MMTKVQSVFPSARTVQALEAASFPVTEIRCLQPLIDRLAQARVVMLGGSTHGTEEFYLWRRIISQWLITKHGFNAIAVEGDWPDARRIHRYVVNGEGESARNVVANQQRWPTWLWANTEVIRMVEWLRSHNSRAEVAGRGVGFFGLDMYSLFESIDSVIQYLEENNPLMARRAKKRYACFDRFSRDEMLYARSTLKFSESSVEDVTRNLEDLLRLRVERGSVSDDLSDDLFDAQQSARVVKNASSYYRAIIRGDELAWNIRDRHMMETLMSLLSAENRKVIVWAHNTHIGDYRATDRGQDGVVNLGGLVREELGEHNVALVGLGTYEGEMTASRAWEGPMQTVTLPPAKPMSYDSVFHSVATKMGSNVVATVLRSDGERASALREPLDQRAVGVVYDPEHERGHYVSTTLAERYDAFVHVDQSHALEPLVLSVPKRKVPETWPAGR